MPGPHRGADRRDAAVFRRRQLDLLHMIAAVRRRHIVLGARFLPLHRPPKLHRAKRRDEVALDLRDLAAEPAADFRRDHAQAVLRHAGNERHDEAHDVGILRRIPQRQLASDGNELRDGAARLDRGRDQPLLNDSIADDDLRRFEGGIDVAAGDGPVKGDVAGNVAV